VKISELIDNHILEAIDKFDGDYSLNNPFEELISFGELVDRLSVVNFKLFKLKDEVMMRPDDQDFRGWASIEDVKLCKERSRLKRCIDEKLASMMVRVRDGDPSAGHNSETKLYGREV
jgi:hypothetical protein